MRARELVASPIEFITLTGAGAETGARVGTETQSGLGNGVRTGAPDTTMRLELQWIEAGPADGDEPGAAVPLAVFLHEGLGSIAMWRDFPARVCAAARCRGLVYSRPGYGRSLPSARGQAWAVDYMHREARSVLPALLQALRPRIGDSPLFLVGHSDGGSIALLHAARVGGGKAGIAASEGRLAGMALLAPHILVEDESIRGIEAARDAWRQGDLPSRLARFHDDAEAVFWRWNDIWLSPAFRSWSIVDDLATIACPITAIQGVDDQYGTLAQIRGIAERVAGTRLVELADCGHSPHRDQPEATITAIAEAIAAAADPAASAAATTTGATTAATASVGRQPLI